MAEASPAPNNRLIKFMDKVAPSRKAGRISDRQAEKRGLVEPPLSDDREMASLKGRVASST